MLANTIDKLKRDLADLVIAQVADTMGTHAVTGTDARDMRSGIDAFLGENWSVQRVGDKACRGSSETVSPRSVFDELAAGHLVIVRFG